ncbi:nuclear transport factor 2 (NTF2) family protein [Actinidia rufa]|uniref:Nuclear transport factor 2 (NTF2) family protein n=1 Tax=Actinidia rufa TaxID=165716 RepID=A0A7J0EBL8_9ERIC|nr:nuclear transport factor 2 (NTF2) family protein [Actinidia rufa]
MAAEKGVGFKKGLMKEKNGMLRFAAHFAAAPALCGSLQGFACAGRGSFLASIVAYTELYTLNPINLLSVYALSSSFHTLSSSKPCPTSLRRPHNAMWQITKTSALVFISFEKSALEDSNALLWKAPHSRCQVKSEDTEGTLSGESVILDEQTLERELQAAIEEENYSRAAKIRDILRVLQEDGKASVLAANSRFYNSFRNGDLAAMQSLWAKGENVCVVHPGVSGISGYDLVMGSWEFVWADYEFPLDIEIKNVQVHVRGDLGYVICTEMVKTKGRSWGRQFATNVFERIDGQWFICIHHASNVDF